MTLTLICPTRRQLIKDKWQERGERKRQFETKNRTYCEVTKLRAELAKVIKPDETVLSLNGELSFTILAITINAHLINLAKPGTFGKEIKELLRLNKLPEINIPVDLP